MNELVQQRREELQKLVKEFYEISTSNNWKTDEYSSVQCEIKQSFTNDTEDELYALKLVSPAVYIKFEFWFAEDALWIDWDFSWNYDKSGEVIVTLPKNYSFLQNKSEWINLLDWLWKNRSDLSEEKVDIGLHQHFRFNSELLFYSVEAIAEWFQTGIWLEFAKQKLNYEIHSYSSIVGQDIASYIRMWCHTPNFIEMMNPFVDSDPNWSFRPECGVKFEGWGKNLWNFWFASMDAIKVHISETTKQERTVYLLQFNGDWEIN